MVFLRLHGNPGDSIWEGNDLWSHSIASRKTYVLPYQAVTIKRSETNVLTRRSIRLQLSVLGMLHGSSNSILW